MFDDANGRTYFALVSVLLLKKGLWLTRQPYYIWSLIDGAKLENLALIYNSLCIAAPMLKKPIGNWRLSLPIEKMMRIACATGDKEMIDNILSENPQLMTEIYQLNKFSIGKTPLNIMKLYHQYALYEYTINHPEFIKILNYYNALKI